LLWQGAYPKDVADLLVEQYHGMEIARIQDKPDRVLPLTGRLFENEAQPDS
jgi:hypothetical protein